MEPSGWNRAHVARHAVTPAEADQVCFERPIFRAAAKGRVTAIGPTEDGRMVTVVIGAKPNEPRTFTPSLPVRRVGRSGGGMLPLRKVKSMTDKEGMHPLPEFTSLEEEAEYWDNYDFGEHWDELQPVDLHVSPNLTSVHSLRVRFDKETWSKLERMSRERETTPDVLAAIWVEERLRAERDGS